MNAFPVSSRVFLCTALLTSVFLLPTEAQPDRRPDFVDPCLSLYTGEPDDSSRNSAAWAEILATLEIAKTKAEDALSESTALLEAGGIFPVEHNSMLTTYAEKRLTVNDLIERMKAHLITGGCDGHALLTSLRTELARIAEKDQAVAKSMDAKNPVVAGLVASAVGSAIDSLISGAVESWLTMKLEQKRMLIAELEGKKWRAPFIQRH